MSRITDSFFESAERVPDKTFIVGPGGENYTYRQTAIISRRFASFLLDHNIDDGDRVMLSFANHEELIFAYLGALSIGCSVVMSDFRSVLQKVQYIISDSGSKIMIGPQNHPAAGVIEKFLEFSKNSLAGYAEVSEERIRRAKNDLALVIYTSGTTGVPKGVSLTHNNLIHTARSIISWADINSDDKELTILRLTHLFGLAHFHCYWSLGGTIYIQESLMDAPEIINLIDTQQITSFPGTPATFKIILDGFSEEFSRMAKGLKYIIINSAPMPPEYTRKLMEILPNTKLYMYYGLTEASRCTYINYNNYPDKLKSVGKPTPGVEVRLEFFSDSPDKKGEILVKGPNVTAGYLNLDSAPYFNNGWFKTGDVGYLDEDGFLYWDGRLRDQINVDGFKFNPEEVEAVLRTHQLVKDCAVIGEYDKDFGEHVSAFIVTDHPTEELALELMIFCKDKIETYKIPRSIKFIAAIPKTESGKVQRYKLLVSNIKQDFQDDARQY